MPKKTTKKTATKKPTPKPFPKKPAVKVRELSPKPTAPVSVPTVVAAAKKAGDTLASADKKLPAPDALLPITQLPEAALVVQTAVNELAAQVTLFTFSSETVTQGQEMMTQLKALESKLEAERKKLTQPIKEQAKRIEGLFKPITEKVEKFRAELNVKYLAFAKAEQERREQSQRQLIADAQKAQASGDADGALALATQAAEVADVQKTAVVNTGSVQLKQPWTFEVTDAGKVPEEYKSIDEKKVRDAIRAGLRDAGDGTPAIPGIRIFQTTTVATSAGPLMGGS